MRWIRVLEGLAMMCRRFGGRPTKRLIVTLPADVVRAIDRLMQAEPMHPARGCRSEFLRLALSEKLGRELMISRAAGLLATAASADDFSSAEAAASAPVNKPEESAKRQRVPRPSPRRPAD